MSRREVRLLGPAGIGQSAPWAIEEEGVGGAAATEGFMHWSPDPEAPDAQSPRTLSVHGRHNDCDASASATLVTRRAVTRRVTRAGDGDAAASQEAGHIYI